MAKSHISITDYRGRKVKVLKSGPRRGQPGPLDDLTHFANKHKGALAAGTMLGIVTVAVNHTGEPGPAPRLNTDTQAVIAAKTETRTVTAT
ncbi:MAG: hypothetical protein AAF213_11475, partial [Pseudomonadota bacterium]